MRRSPTLRATPSLRLSLASKTNDRFTLVVPTRDSVTFSTARYRFDINHIAVLATKMIASGQSCCSLTICNGGTNEILLFDHINFCTFSMLCACNSRYLGIMEQYLISLFGWMTAINLGFFFIGLLKVTLLRDITLRVTRILFGNHFDSMMDAAPRILMQYYILILLFNLVPYFALRLTS